MLRALFLSLILAIPHGQIAYVMHDGEQSDIYLIWADGHGMRQISSTLLADEAGPRWSPSGRILSFSSNDEGFSNIMLYLLDSSRTIQVSNNKAADIFPSFFPNGTMLSFERWSGGEQSYPTLIGTTLYGTNPKVLATNAFNHSWSPVTGQLMYIAPDGLTIADRNGQNAHKILPKTVSVLQAAWSPNDMLIAFIGVVNGQSNIYTISINGNGLKNITNSNSIEEQLTWSPAGNKIAYVVRPENTTPDNSDKLKKRAIRIVDTKTQKRITLTDGTSECHSPTWSPDGSGLAFVCCYVTTACQLYVADVTANTMRPITTVPVRISDPQWSPELVFRNN